MKKLLTILLCCSLLLTVLATASCSAIGGIGELISNLAGEETDDDSDSDIDVDVDVDTDEGGSGNTSGELPYDKDSAQSKLLELGKKDGYEITLTTTNADGETNTYVTGRKGSTIWVITNGKSGNAFVDDGGQSVTVYNYNDGTWSLENTMVGQGLENLAAVYTVSVNTYLFIANSYEDSMTRTGTGKVVGRDVIKYTYSAGNFAAAAKFNADVDKALGITLKWKIEVAADGQRAGTEMEVTSFKTGSSVTLPDLPAAGEEYMDYSGALGWPDNSFTALIPQAPGKVSMSGIQGDNFVCMAKEVSDADYRTFLSGVMAKGFDGTEQGPTFQGEDAQGNTIQLSFADGTLTIQMTRAAR